MHEVIVWVWGSVTHGNAVEQYTWALSVLIRTLLPKKHGLRACEDGNVVLVAACLGGVHWWSCVRRFVAASLRDGRAVLPEYSVLGGLIALEIWTHLSLCFCVVSVRVWGPSEGGIVYGLFSKESLYIGKASVNRTHCPGLAARFTEYVQCLYRPGLKGVSKPRYRLLRRRLQSLKH